MPLRNLKYSKKVQVLFIPVFAIMAVGLLLVYHTAARGLKAEHYERLLRTTLLTEEGLTATEKEMMKMANLFQTNRTLKEYLYISTVLGGDREPLRDLLKPLAASLELDDLDVYDNHGRRVVNIVTVLPSDPKEERLAAVTGSLPKAPIHGFTEDSGTLKIVAVSPLYEKNSVVGYIAIGKFLARDYLRELKEISGNELFRLDTRNRIISEDGRAPASYAPVNGKIAIGGTVYSTIERSVTSINGEPLGKLAIALSDDDLMASKARLKHSMFAMLGLAALLSFVLSKLFIRTLVDPLKAITSFTGKVARGEPAGALPVRGHDEIADLAAHFNEMQLQLKAERDIVEHYTVNLERRVEERTAELKQVQRQLLHSQKMEAIGQLSGGIAHDFNNFLTAILGYAEMLRKRLKHDGSASMLADQIIEAAKRAAAVTRGLLAFSRKQVIMPVPVDLNAIVRNSERLLARLVREDITFTSRLAAGPLVILGDTVHVEQVIMNLVTNARDAMPEGGRLTIETEIRKMGDDFIKRHSFGRHGTYAVLSVTDTGSGMDPAIRGKIFEPFYTTKEVGKGTGLGLSIVYGIIKQHEGYIDVISAKGAGTTISIYLPIVRQDLQATGPGREKLAPRGGSETVLLVEDDRAIREMEQTALEEAGYTVIPASDGSEAVEQFRGAKKDVHLLILDVVMPQKNGKAAYEEIKKIRPRIKVLFTSGYASDILSTRGVLEEGLELMQKPISTDDLLRKVRTVLDGAGAETRERIFADE